MIGSGSPTLVAVVPRRTNSRAGEVTGDLRHLEAVREPVADEVVALRTDHLGLGRQPTARRGVDDPRPVTLERRALRRGHALGWLVHPALARGVVVLGHRR